MRRPLVPVAFVVFALSLAAWGGVWFLFSDISGRLAARADALSSAGQQASQQGSEIALHALVADTVEGRAQLDAAVDTDVVGIAGAINAAGKSAGARTTIGSASVVASASSTGVSELEFVVQATGTFAQVWRTAELFQTLPLPSSASELDFEQIPNAAPSGALWQLTAHIDVLTSAQVSS